MSVFFEYGNFGRISQQKSNLFPPWTTDPKVGSISVVLLALPLPSNSPVRTEMRTHSAFMVYCCNIFTFILEETGIEGLLHSIIFSSSNYSDCLGNLNLPNDSNKTSQNNKPSKLQQLTVPATSSLKPVQS